LVGIKKAINWEKIINMIVAILDSAPINIIFLMHLTLYYIN